MARHGSRAALVFLQDPYEVLELRHEAPLRKNAHFGHFPPKCPFRRFPVEKFNSNVAVTAKTYHVPCLGNLWVAFLSV